MSSKILKQNGVIELPGDEVIVHLRIFKSNRIQLEAPSVHPRDICKMLSNLIIDLQYASLQPTEDKQIDTSQTSQIH